MAYNYGKLPTGVKKHIRIQKSFSRREFPGIKERTEVVDKLYNKFSYYLKKRTEDISPDKPKNTSKKNSKKPTK